MQFIYDPDKSYRNEVERGMPFGLVEDFEWTTARIIEDTRTDYGERRYRAMGMIGADFCVVVFTPRGEALRIISLRRGNDRERKVYEQP